MTLPAHMRTIVRAWLAYDKTTTPPWASRYAFERLAEKPRSSRVQIWTALSEYHRRYTDGPDPFGAQPLSQPIRTKFVPVSFDEAWEWLKSQPPPTRAAAALALLCRVSDPLTWTTDLLKNNRVGGIPLTDEVVGWLRDYTPPTKAEIRKWPWTPADLHLALFAELGCRGVPEVTRAALYGRWSAMALRVAVRPVGLFRTARSTGSGSA